MRMSGSRARCHLRPSLRQGCDRAAETTAPRQLPGRQVPAIALRLIVAGALFLAPPTVSQYPTREKAQELAHEIRKVQLATASPTEVVAPFYSVKDGATIRLIVLNTTLDPVAFDAAAFGPDGDALPLGTFLAPVRRHLELDLTQAIDSGGEGFATGSLQLSWVGDASTLSTWLIFEENGRLVEIPLAHPQIGTNGDFFAFWDTIATGGAEPHLFLVNAGFTDAHVVVSGAIQSTFELAPRQQKLLTFPAQATGWLKVISDPVGLVAAGLVRGSDHLGRLPVLPLQAGYNGPVAWEGLPSGIRGAPTITAVTLFNSSGYSTRSATLMLIDETTGSTVREVGVDLAPLQMRTRILTSPASQPGLTRARVETSGPGVLISGRVMTRSAEWADISFVFGDYGHGSGTYPLLPLEEFETRTSIVNLGEEASEVGAHISWEGGEYSYGPFEIGAGASYYLDVDEMIQAGAPDLLGRRLGPDLEGAFLRWSVRSGSRNLVARTHARPRYALTPIGFNCLGCCWEFPFGAVIPDYVEFLPFDSVSFQASVYTQTCSGIDGPWGVSPQSMNTPSPFSWNASQLSATDAADEQISFVTLAPALSESCQVFYDLVPGMGRGDTCRHHLRKPGGGFYQQDNIKQCSRQTTSCAECLTCCEKNFQYRLCRGIQNSEALHMFNLCLTWCQVDLGCNFG